MLMPRRGRPPVNPERRLSVSVTTRVTDAQYQRILSRAKELGITEQLATQYLRWLIAQDLKTLNTQNDSQPPKTSDDSRSTD